MGSEAAIVRIRRAAGADGSSPARIVGLGFAVGERQIVTCAHVLNTALGRPQKTPGDPGPQVVLVEFPFAGSRTDLLVRAATITSWGPGPEPFDLHDVAGLELTEPVPPGCRPVALTGSDGAGTRVQMWGPSPDRPTGGHVTGELLGHVDKGRLHVEQEIRGVFQATGGFSGGPVWAVDSQRVVGMLVAVGTLGAETDVYVLSADVLADSWPEVLFRPPPCPYPGLRAFGAGDAGRFFGREEFVRALVQARTVPVQLIVGPSGAGKSSVLDAGLVPALRARSRLAVVRAQPGDDPVMALAAGFAAAARPDHAGAAVPVADLEQWQDRLTAKGLAGCGRLLRSAVGAELVVIVVDQLEQALAGPDGEAPAIVGLLRDLIEKPATGVLAVAALRDDYFGRLIGTDPVVGDFLQRTARVLRPLTRDALREAVVQPARRGEPHEVVEFEDGLVDLLLDDFRGAAATLPLLQFTLQQLWQRQERRRLTFAAYHQMGGIAEALTRYADGVVDGLPGADESAVRRIFTALVTPGTQDVGRRLPRSQMRPADWPVALRLAAERLVVVRHGDDRTAAVEVAHEVLLRQWPRLRSWLELDRAFLSWRGGVESAAAGWQESGREADLLLRGRLLLRAEDMIAQYPDDTRHLHDFVRHSRAAAEESDRQRQVLYDRAEARRLAAQAELARLGGRVAPSVVLALAIASLARHSTLEGDVALRHALELAPTVIGSHDDGAPLHHLAFSPDSALVACGGAGGRVVVLDSRTARVVTEIPCRGPVERVLFAGPAMLVVAAQDQDGDEEVWLHSAGSGELVARLGGPRDRAAVAVSGPGHRIAVGGASRSGPGDVRVYDAAGTELRRVRPPDSDDEPAWMAPDGAEEVALSPDGRYLAVAWTSQVDLVEVASGRAHRLHLARTVSDPRLAFNAAGSLLAVHGRTGGLSVHQVPPGEDAEDAEARVVDVPQRWVTGIAFGHYDWSLAVAYGYAENASGDGLVQIIDAESGRVTTEIPHRRQVRAVAFGRDDALVATGGDDHRARVFRASSGRVVAHWNHTGMVHGVAISADGRVAASVGDDGRVQLVAPVAGAELAVLSTTGRLRTCDFTREGLVVAAGQRCGVTVWHAARGAERRRLLDRRTVSYLAIDPAASVVLAAASADHREAHDVILCDFATGEHRRELHYDAEVTAVALSADASVAAVGLQRSGLRLLDLRTGVDAEVFAVAGRTWSLRFGPDATVLAAAVHGPDGDSVVHLLDLHRPGTAHERWHSRYTGIVAAVDVHPDGNRLVVAGWDGTVRVLDATDGAELLRVDHDNSVSDVRFSPGGDRLVTCCLDGTVRVVDAGSGREHHRMTHPAGSDAWVNAVAWNPAGTVVASSGDDGAVRLWALGDALVAQGRERMTRPLTEAEQRRYLQEEPGPGDVVTSVEAVASATSD